MTMVKKNWPYWLPPDLFQSFKAPSNMFTGWYRINEFRRGDSPTKKAIFYLQELGLTHQKFQLGSSQGDVSRHHAGSEDIPYINMLVKKTWLFSSCDAWHPQVANSKTHKAPPNANTPFDIGGTSATFDLDCRDRHEIHFLGWWNHQKSTTSNIWTGSSSEIELPTDPHNWSCLVFTHPFWYMLMVYVCILSHSYLVC